MRGGTPCVPGTVQAPQIRAVKEQKPCPSHTSILAVGGGTAGIEWGGARGAECHAIHCANPAPTEKHWLVKGHQ